jgi:hypothetical protein
MRRQGLGEEAIRAALRVENDARCEPPLDDDEVDRIAASIAGYPAGADPVRYVEQDGTIHLVKTTRDGPVTVPLCNFTARIIEEVVHDDGAEQTRRLAVQGTLAVGDALPRYEIPAAEFPGMGWVISAWGTRAVVYSGNGTKDHLRVAMQLLSSSVPRRTVFGHTGWREIDGAWLYLHAGGAVGPVGPVAGIEVSLPDALGHFLLPTPPEGRVLRDDIRASLQFLELGPPWLTFPVLAAVFRAVLGDTDFALHLAGPTGTYKSEAAALAQQHFGAGLDARHLPGSWSSTGNALEGLCFSAKDAPLVVDDFAPAGSVYDVQRYHKEAERLLRAQGNRAGRQRMRADATLRPAKPPRGLILSTGEDVPRGQSLRARLLVLDVGPGDFGPQPPDLNPALSACQDDAAGGKYAAAMAGFLRWIAPQYAKIRGRLQKELAKLRSEFSGSGQHARTPGVLADLALGLHYLLRFAVEVGAIDRARRDELWQRGRDALDEAGREQAKHLAGSEPTGMFLRLLTAVLASGRAHVTDLHGDAPPNASAWGWRGHTRFSGNGSDDTVEHTDWQSCGCQIGWVDGDNLYLEPEASYAEAQRLAREQGESLTVSSDTLRRRLSEKGLLVSCDKSRQKLTIRKTLGGTRRNVLHLSAAAFTSPNKNRPNRPIRRKI